MENEIESALDKLVNTPELLSKLDRRLRYEITNRKERSVGIGKKLEALYKAGLLIVIEQN